MKKVLVVLCVGLLGVCSVGAFASAEEDFSVMWLVDMPRDIYFIGETITVTLTAYSSQDSTLLVPSEMCLVTIRNESLAEAYSAWFTTDFNGTALVTWDIPLNADVGNYSFVLSPLSGDNIICPFFVLYDENTYWQKRVELLEDELRQQYEYLNYLYANSNYQGRQIDILKDRVMIAGCVMFVTILVSMAVAFPEWARQANAANLKKGVGSKLAKLMGFSNTPQVLLTDFHVELAQLKTPSDKRPLRYGLVHHCSMCDPDNLEPMTKRDYDEHIKSHYKNLWSLRSRRRNNIYKSIIKDHYKLPNIEPEHEKIIRAEKRRYELIDSVESSKKELKAIEAERKQTIVRDKELKKKFKTEKKASKKKRTLFRKNEPVLKVSTSSKPVSQQKVREKKPLSARIKSVDDARTVHDASWTQIDDLYEKLSKDERVN